MLFLIIWVVALVVAVWLYLRQVYSSFAKRGIKHRKPMPIIGNMGKMMNRTEHLADQIIELYHEFPGERFFGRYEMTTEMIIIKDLELVKKVAVKDFEHFTDHRELHISKTSFFARQMFFMRGNEWKDMRSTLSPAFTSSKIRHMVPFMLEVGEQMVQSLKNQIKERKGDYIDIDSKDLSTRNANDIIASCAFGLKVDSHSDADNEFYTVGRSTTNFTLRHGLMFLLTSNIPALTKVIQWDLMTDDARNFFKTLVMDTMKDRELRNILRPDMIHLLMEARKGKLTHEDVKPNDDAAGFATVEESSVGTKKVDRTWSDDDLVAQAVLFFIAGFETVSSTMSFMLYELATNPEAQEKLAQEIKEQDRKNNGKFDFGSIQAMPYLDMVVSEVLRLWPPVIVLDRTCIKDYNLGKPNAKAENDVIIRKGQLIGIPAYGFHRDPAYFPNPNKFDPERFSEENKHKIQSFSYMPFGTGPRNCIGSRFALCEVKVMTYQILQHFVVSPCAKTCIPAKLCPKSHNIKLEGGHWLRFQVRS